MTFAGVANNVRLFLVCWVVVLDMGHDNYLMTVTNGYWLPHGLVEAGYDSHTLLQGCLTQRFSVPKVCACDNMQSLPPSAPTWAHLPSLDLWSWFGGLSQGALAAGWVVAVAVDHCRTMVGLYEQACDAPVICGDFGDLAVLPDIWKQSYGASSLSPSFSCQTPSRLGAGMCCHDGRVRGFPTTLDACDKTLSLHPSTPMWANLPSLVDFCSELGGLSQGAIAAGWVVAVAVDHCLQMVGLYEQACDAPVICDDFGDLAVLPAIWKQSFGASSLLSGFSCQPYLRLGGGRGLHDERACGLPTTLAAAYYLQSWIIVLDCVSPAGADASANSNVMWCTGNPGPVYSGSWQDGCAVPHLHLGGFGLKQRTTWFIKVLKQSLRHRFVRLSLGSGRPHSHLFLFHPGILFLLWLAALDALDRWLSSFSNGTFQRHLQAMDSFPATSCVQLPVVPLTTG